MNNQLKATIITKNSKDTTTTPLTAKQGELVVDYTVENKPIIKVGPAGTGAKQPVELYAKCEQIANNSGVKISETGQSTFGNMKSTSDGINADGKGLTNLGILALKENISYGTSLPEGTEGQVFFLIQSK